MIIVLKIKENWGVSMGDAEGCCSGVGLAVAQVWGVKGRVQWVRVVERPTVFCGSWQLGAYYRQPLLVGDLAPSSSREEEDGGTVQRPFPSPHTSKRNCSLWHGYGGSTAGMFSGSDVLHDI